MHGRRLVLRAEVCVTIIIIIIMMCGNGRALETAPLRRRPYAVTDFKVNTVDVELGVGHGFTSGSDGLIIKAIIGYAFPVPGKGDDGSSPSMPLAMVTSARAAQNAWSMK